VFGSKSGGFGGSTFGGFGAAPAKPAEGSGSQEEEEETGSSAIAASDVADDSKSLPTKTHDEEGEGEEDEETTHTTKSKVYKLHKKDDGGQEWKDLGVGMLRLKTHTTTGSRRVLLRNSSTGKVTINFNIYSGLNPSLATKFITFVGHDEDGVSATYKLRTQSDQHAADLKIALDREIAFVKGED
jgi:nucleoporin NUP2